MLTDPLGFASKMFEAPQEFNLDLLDRLGQVQIIISLDLVVSFHQVLFIQMDMGQYSAHATSKVLIIDSPSMLITVVNQFIKMSYLTISLWYLVHYYFINLKVELLQKSPRDLKVVLDPYAQKEYSD